MFKLPLWAEAGAEQDFPSQLYMYFYYTKKIEKNLDPI